MQIPCVCVDIRPMSLLRQLVARESIHLPNHNPITQTVPDNMHTVKVVVEHLFMLTVGKD